MSRLLAISFDCQASPSIKLKGIPEYNTESQQDSGWGIGWYPEDDYAAAVIKNTKIAENQEISSINQKGAKFLSTTFTSYLRGASKRLTHQDTQPLRWSYSGREWLFTHNGDFAPDWKTKLSMESHSVFEPLGRTDSEHAFCWLLSEFKELNARKISQINYNFLLELFQKLNLLGESNFTLTDGLDLVVYQDQNNFNPIYWNRRIPPYKDDLIETEDCTIQFSNSSDLNRSMVMFLTVPPLNINWQVMQPGQMLVIRKGAIVWDSTLEPQLQNDFTSDLSEVSMQAQQEAVEEVQFTGEQTRAIDMPEGLFTQYKNNEPNPNTHDIQELFVEHTTTYTYDSPVNLSKHLLRLNPVQDREQTLKNHMLDISVSGANQKYEDVFGNQSNHIEINEPYSELIIKTAAVVKNSLPRVSELIPLEGVLSLPMVWMPWQREMMQAYLLPVELPESQLKELSDYAISFVERNDRDLISVLKDINNTIYKDYTYKAGSTNLETTPFEVFVNRRGVCQDFANLFICMARLLNVPARYRVGYIYTGGNYINKVQSDASHAWLEVYLPGLGWKGFDPTNGCPAGVDHIRVACGRHYRDATPTSGTIFSGGGNEKLSVDVKVVKLPLS